MTSPPDCPPPNNCNNRYAGNIKFNTDDSWTHFACVKNVTAPSQCLNGATFTVSFDIFRYKCTFMTGVGWISLYRGEYDDDECGMSPAFMTMRDYVKGVNLGHAYWDSSLGKWKISMKGASRGYSVTETVHLSISHMNSSGYYSNKDLYAERPVASVYMAGSGGGEPD